jgi:hypothetical protein
VTRPWPRARAGRHRRRSLRLRILGAGGAAALVLVALALTGDRGRSDSPAAGAPATTASRGPGHAGVGEAPGPSAGPDAAGSRVDRPDGNPGPPGTQIPREFPGPDDTGVPAGVELTPYQGECEIREANTVIEARVLECPLNIYAPDVVVRNSKVVGQVDVLSGSLTIEDSEVDNGTNFSAAVGGDHLTVLRSDIHGGETSVNCGSCHIEDSWLHGQYVPPDGDWHLDAYLSNGGSDVTLVHNTLACDHPGTPNGGGCTAAAAIFGDFGPLSNFTFDGNLFVASPNLAYCFYGGTQDNKPYGLETTNIVVVNNVFQRGQNGECGGYGPVTAFDENRPGHRWEGNVWDDGEPLGPSR